MLETWSAAGCTILGGTGNFRGRETLEEVGQEKLYLTLVPYVLFLSASWVPRVKQICPTSHPSAIMSLLSRNN